MIEAAANAGAKSIVSAGTGAGRPTPTEDAAFDKAYKEKGMLMCLCNRVAAGRVVRSPGLQRRGFTDNSFYRLLLFTLIALNGCSSHVDFSAPFDPTTRDRIAVALDPTLENKVESSSVVWEQGTYALGPALARVIDNRSDAPSRIDYVSSNLVITQSVSWFLSGTMIADYTLLVKHNASGSSSLVEARGKAISYWSSFNAGQEAIEKAMLDLVTKLKALR